MDDAAEGLAHGDEPLYYRVRWPPGQSLLKNVFIQNGKQAPIRLTTTYRLSALLFYNILGPSPRPWGCFLFLSQYTWATSDHLSFWL